MYTIGQVSEMFLIPISTLRYYDKEGLFPDLKRQSGIRQFEDHDLENIRVIECLKASGLEISDIKHYFELCKEGNSTFAARKQLFENRKKAVEEEMKRLQKTLDLLKYKCWFYEKAIEDGSLDGIHAMLPDKLPEEIQKFYDNGHK
ncbi:MAG: MerR family transcriptional regulator [Lachnospiraceae bacterium]|nr:MerR family transcriptional regulator [Lachnospiraceae bacterium]